MNLPAIVGDAGDTVSIPGLGRFPEGGNCNPLQYYCLENSMDRKAWRAIVHGIAKSQTQLSTHTHTQELCANVLYTLLQNNTGIHLLLRRLELREVV